MIGCGSHTHRIWFIDALETAAAARGGGMSTAQSCTRTDELNTLRRSRSRHENGVGCLSSTFSHEYYYRHTFNCTTESVVTVNNWLNFCRTPPHRLQGLDAQLHQLRTVTTRACHGRMTAVHLSGCTSVVVILPLGLTRVRVRARRDQKTTKSRPYFGRCSGLLALVSLRRRKRAGVEPVKSTRFFQESSHFR